MISKTISLYTNAFKGLSSSTWLLALVMLVNRSGTMVLPFLTIYLTQPSMGYSIAQAGVVMGIFGLGAICGGFLGGKLTDKFGFHKVQLITLGGGGVMFIVLGQMKSYPLICIFTFLLSLINEAFRPANSIAVAHYSEEENRTRSYSLNRIAINLGWAVGGAIGGILASINYHLLFWVDGFTNILAVFLLQIFLSKAKEQPVSRKEDIIIDKSHTAYRDRTYLLFITLTIVFGMCFFQFFSTLPVFYKKILHLNESFIGMLMALNGLIITFLEMIFVFNMEGRRENIFFIGNGVLLVGLSYLMLNILPLAAPTAVFCIVLITFGEILAMPFMNSFWIARAASHNRGQYAGLYTIAWSVAQVLGPTLGSLVAEHQGFKILWWLTAIICFATSIVFRFFTKISM